MSDFEKLRSDAIAKIDISLKFIEGVSQIDEAKKKFLRRRLDALRAEIKESKCNCSDEIMKQSMYNQLRQTVDKALKEIFSTTHSTVYVENEMTYHPINQEMLFVTREQAARITALERDILRFRRIIAERDAAINRLNALNREVAEHIHNMRTQMRTSEQKSAADIRQLRTDLAAATARGDRFFIRNGELTAIILQLQEDASDQRLTLGKRNQIITDLRARIEWYINELNRTNAENKQLSKDKERLTQLAAQLQAERDAFAVYVLKIYQSFRKLSGDGNLEDTKDVREAMEGYELIERYSKIVMRQLQELLGNHGDNLVGIYGKLDDALKNLSDQGLEDKKQGAHNALLEAYTELKAMHDRDRERYDEVERSTGDIRRRLSAQINQLTEENAKQKAELQQQQEDLINLREQLALATNQLAACVERLTSTEGKLETCRQENTEKDTTIAELRERIAELERSIETYKEQLEEQKKKAAYNETFANIFVELQVIFDKLKGYGVQISDGKLVEGIHNGVDFLIDQNTRLRKITEQLASDTSDAPPRVEYKIQAPDKRYSQLQERLRLKEDEYKLLEEENKNIRINLKKSNETLEKVRTSLQNAYQNSSSADQLQRIVDEQKAKINKQASELNSYASRVEQFNVQNGLQAEEIKRLNEENRYLTTQKADFDKKLKTQKFTMQNKIDLMLTYIDELVLETNEFLKTFAENWNDGKVVLIDALREYQEKIQKRRDGKDKVTLNYSKEDNEIQTHLGTILNYVDSLITKINGGIYPQDSKTGSGEQFHHTKHVSPYEPRYTGGAVESTPPTSAISYLIGLIILLVIYILYAVVSWLIESPRKKRPKVLFVNCKSADSVNPSKIEIAPLSVE